MFVNKSLTSHLTPTKTPHVPVTSHHHFPPAVCCLPSSLTPKTAFCFIIKEFKGRLLNNERGRASKNYCLLPAGWWMKKMVEEDVFPLQPASQPAVK
jgi:hypothetical protein